MEPTIEIKLPEEKILEENEPTVIEQALEVVAVANVIAKEIDDAKEDDGDVIVVLEKLDSIESGIAALFVRMDGLVELVTALSAPAVIVEPEPAPVVVDDNAPDVVVEAEDNSTVIVEEVPEAITPQIKKKKARRWL